MSSFYDDASLVVIPSGYKTSKVYAEKPTDGSGDLTFTRTGDTATRVNSAGLIEKVRTNLVLQSEQFNVSPWTLDTGSGTGSITVTNNYALSPIGTMTADRFQMTKGSVYAQSYQGVTVTNGQIYTASVYLKSLSGTPSVTMLFSGTAVQKTLTTEWVRYTTTFTGASGVAYTLIGLYTADSATADILAWGYQLEVSDFGATSYIPTTTAAVSVGPVANVPRLDYLGSTCPRLLLEPQRTNLLQFSEQIDNAYWTKQDASITANTSVSPDGYTNADSLIENSATAQHLAMRTAITITTATAYTASVYFKANTRTRAAIQLAGTGFFDTANGLVIFNLSTGAIISQTGNATGTITSVGNGWYRCTATKTSVGTSGVVAFNLVDSSNNTSYAGNGTSGVFLWGAQLEVGAYATSYIPTLAASATRGTDDATKTGITSLIGQTEGTLFLDFEGGANDSANHFLGLSDGTTGNRIVIVRSSSNTLYAQIRVGGVEQAFIQTATLTDNTRYKCAIAYKANDIAFYVNGALVGTDTSATIPATSVFATNTGVSSSFFERAINQTLVFKTRLTNAELATLTTI